MNIFLPILLGLLIFGFGVMIGVMIEQSPRRTTITTINQTDEHQNQTLSTINKTIGILDERLRTLEQR
jgi:hypothetical protein